MNPGESLELTIVSDELAKLTKDLSEIVIDSILDDGVIKDLPGMSFIFSGFKIYSTIKERANIKKLYKFLYELHDIPNSDREKFVKSFCDERDKQEFFERLLFLIDRQDDVYKSTIVGKLFANTIKEKISTDNFIRCTLAIERTYITDLQYLKHRYTSDIYHSQQKWLVQIINSGNEDMIKHNLEISGLLNSRLEENIRKQERHGAEKKISKKYSLSNMGEILVELGF